MSAAPGPEPVYFVDHDGRVFLVRDRGTLRLPRRAEVPFAFAERRRLTLRGQDVVIAAPADKQTHAGWPWKDDLPFAADVDPLAKLASNLTVPRCVAKAVFLRGGEALLVRPSTGFYAGRWSLPGGYLDYGEGPEECVLREAEEELGAKGEVTRLLRIDSQVVATGYHFLTFTYEGRLHTQDLRLKEDEIAEARWFPVGHAAAALASAHSRAAVEMLLREERFH